VGLSIDVTSAVGFMRDLFEFCHPRLSVPLRAARPTGRKLPAPADAARRSRCARGARAMSRKAIHL